MPTNTLNAFRMFNDDPKTMIVDENLKTKMSWNYSCGIVDARIPLNPREPDAYRPGACALMRIRWNDLRKRFEVVGDPNEKSCVWFCNEFWIHMRNEIFVGTICSHPDEKKSNFRSLTHVQASRWSDHVKFARYNS